MKKSCTYIILLMLLALSICAGNFSISKRTAEANNAFPASTCFTSNFNSPDSEIEHYSSNNNNVLPSSQGIQNVPGHFNFYVKAIVTIPAVGSLNSFEHVELFDNNYLRHNYPSHNFW